MLRKGGNHKCKVFKRYAREKKVENHCFKYFRPPGGSEVADNFNMRLAFLLCMYSGSGLSNLSTSDF